MSVPRRSRDRGRSTDASEAFKTPVRSPVQNTGHGRNRDDARLGDRYVDDPAAAAAFYERTFGLRTDFVVLGEYAQMDTGSTKLGFATYALARGNFDGGVDPAGSGGPPPNVEIALVAEDVDAAYRIAVDAGCEPLAAPSDKPQGQRVGWVRDPFGMLVELATPL
jgi:lactoylglutathione lyase